MPEVVLPASLQERIAQEQYRPADESDLPENVKLGTSDFEPRPDSADPLPPSPETDALTPTGVDTPAPPQPQAASPQVDPAVVQQIMQRQQQLEEANRQLLMQQRMQELQADEQRFADSIAHLPQWQQEQLLHERERQQAQTINLHLQQQLMQMNEQLHGQSAAETHKAEMVAKRIIAFQKASAAGLDYQNPVVFASLTSDHIKDPTQMDHAVRGLLSLTGGQGGPKAIVAGGARATNAGAPGPRKGSGDLGGLINSRSYEIVPTE